MSGHGLTTPLEETIRRLGPAADRLVFSVRDDHETIPAGRLLTSPGDLAAAVGRFGRALRTDEPAVATSLFAQAWASAVTRAAVACLSTERRVPDVSAANTRLVIDGDGRPVAVQLNEPRMAVLRGDIPGSTTGGSGSLVDVVEDLAGLYAWARRRFVDDHLAAVVDALGRLSPVGRRLLWGNVSASVAGAFAALSALPAYSPPAERLLADCAALLDVPGSSTEGLAHLSALEHRGRVRLFARRETCCLRYRLPDSPPSCLSCRLISEDERRERIAVSLAEPV